MSSALTVIVLGHAFFNAVPNTLPIQLNSTEAPSTTEIRATTPSPSESSTPTPDDGPVRALRANYSYIPGIGYHKVHRHAKAWDDARLICKEEGGDLAIINSKAEAIIVGQLIAISQPHIDSEYSDMAHIGFTDRESEGRYVTLHGESLSEAGYETWASGEPNDGGDRWSTDDCGAIGVDGDLVDANCVRRYAFVCELPDPIDSYSSVLAHWWNMRP